MKSVKWFYVGAMAIALGMLTFATVACHDDDDLSLIHIWLCLYFTLHTESGRKHLRYNDNLRYSTKTLELLVEQTVIFLFIFPNNIGFYHRNTDRLHDN